MQSMSRVPPLFESIRVMNPGLPRPTGPARAGLLAAVIAGVVPLIAALLLALIVGAAVYLVATAITRLLSAVGIRTGSPAGASTAPPEPERENVRVRR